MPLVDDSVLLSDTPHGIIIAGLPHTGKKTLFNTLYGWQAVGDSSERVRSFGRFTLIDLQPETPLYLMEQAALILYVIDGSIAAQQLDFAWIARLRALNVPLMLTVNRLRGATKSERAQALSELETRLGGKILTVDAHHSGQVHQHFIPQVMKLMPSIAPTLASELHGLRAVAAQQVIHEAALTWLTGDETTHESLTPEALCTAQMRVLTHISGLFGRPSPQGAQSILIQRFLRQASEHVLKALAHLPGTPSRLIQRGVCALSTYLVGWAAVSYYAHETPPVAPKKSLLSLPWRRAHD